MSADKGGGVVIQNQSTYVYEAERILSDTEYYIRLYEDPTLPFQSAFDELIKQVISRKILSKLR